MWSRKLSRLSVGFLLFFVLGFFQVGLLFGQEQTENQLETSPLLRQNVLEQLDSLDALLKIAEEKVNLISQNSKDVNQRLGALESESRQMQEKDKNNTNDQLQSSEKSEELLNQSIQREQEQQKRLQDAEKSLNELELISSDLDAAHKKKEKNMKIEIWGMRIGIALETIALVYFIIK